MVQVHVHVLRDSSTECKKRKKGKQMGLLEGKGSHYWPLGACAGLCAEYRGHLAWRLPLFKEQ